MTRHDFSLLADYHQFYLQDEPSEGINGDSWTSAATDMMLAVAPGAVGVGTATNMDVPVAIEILEQEPARDFENWDRVNECSLDVSSQAIVIAGCTDYFPDAARISVTPGQYRVRVSYALRSNAESYRLPLRTASPIDPTILKRAP